MDISNRDFYNMTFMVVVSLCEFMNLLHKLNTCASILWRVVVMVSCGFIDVVVRVR